MVCYVETYSSVFDRHLVLLYTVTFTLTDCLIDLLLAVATLGAQAAVDYGNVIMFYRSSLAIAHEDLRFRKDQRREGLFFTLDVSSS